MWGRGGGGGRDTKCCSEVPRPAAGCVLFISALCPLILNSAFFLLSPYSVFLKFLIHLSCRLERSGIGGVALLDPGLERRPPSSLPGKRPSERQPALAA